MFLSTVIPFDTRGVLIGQLRGSQLRDFVKRADRSSLRPDWTFLLCVKKSCSINWPEYSSQRPWQFLRGSRTGLLSIVVCSTTAVQYSPQPPLGGVRCAN